MSFKFFINRVVVEVEVDDFRVKGFSLVSNDLIKYGVYRVAHVITRYCLRKGILCVAVPRGSKVINLTFIVSNNSLFSNEFLRGLIRDFVNNVLKLTNAKIIDDDHSNSLDIKYLHILASSIAYLALSFSGFKQLTLPSRSRESLLKGAVIVDGKSLTIYIDNSTYLSTESKIRGRKLKLVAEVSLNFRLPKLHSIEGFKPGIYLRRDKEIIRVKAYGPSRTISGYLLAVLPTTIDKFKVKGETLLNYYLKRDIDAVSRDDKVALVITEDSVDEEVLTELINDLEEVGDDILKVSSTEELSRILPNAQYTVLSYPASVVMMLSEELEGNEVIACSKCYEVINEVIQVFKKGIRELIRRTRPYYRLKCYLRRVNLNDVIYINLLPKGMLRHYFIPLDMLGKDNVFTIKLMYGSSGVNEDLKRRRCKSTQLSPSYAFMRCGCSPLPSKVNVSLHVLIPSKELEEDLVREFISKLANKFSNLKLGSLKLRSIRSYDPNDLRSLSNLIKDVVEGLGSEGLKDNVVMVIDPTKGRGPVYVVAKKEASKQLYHALIVKLDTVDKVLRGRGDEALVNIAGELYQEVRIQQMKLGEDMYATLTWCLSSPADEEGSTLYIGIDVGRSRERGGSNLAAIVTITNAWASAIAVKTSSIRGVKGEKIPQNYLREAIEDAVSIANEFEPNVRVGRLFVMRDGTLWDSELRTLQNLSLSSINESNVVITSVIKSAKDRIFFIDNKGRKFNPAPGTAVLLGKYVDRVTGEEVTQVLIQASHKQVGKGKVKEIESMRPILMNIFKSDRPWKEIAKEYIALTRMNTANLVTGMSKLALPLNLADTISKLASLGLNVETFNTKARKHIIPSQDTDQ